MHIPKQTNRYEVWSKILAKHEKNWAETQEFNLDALWSNYCQTLREVRKGRMSLDDFNLLKARYFTLRAAILASNLPSAAVRQREEERL